MISYGVKQVDYDVQYNYSDLASVRYNSNRETTIYPNTATSEVKVSIPYDTKLTITDIYGRIIQTNSIREGENSIDIKDLPSGFYIFAIENGYRYKILKA